jgi:putative transposase
MSQKNHIELSDLEVSSLTSPISSGHLPARVFRRATALLELSRGKSLAEVAQTLSLTYQRVAAWRDSYHERGLDALQDKPRSGRLIRIDGAQRARITALACSTPPEGRARWSLRLLADKAVAIDHAPNE